ncbi:MAG: BolA family protein [Pseudomonadota bacterium]
MTIKSEIQRKLEVAFAPSELEVIDDSESHRGHAGFREGGETHFNVRITAPGFAGMGRMARHRAVHDALGKDILNRIHALSLKISD